MLFPLNLRRETVEFDADWIIRKSVGYILEWKYNTRADQTNLAGKEVEKINLYGDIALTMWDKQVAHREYEAILQGAFETVSVT